MLIQQHRYCLLSIILQLSLSLVPPVQIASNIPIARVDIPCKRQTVSTLSLTNTKKGYCVKHSVFIHTRKICISIACLKYLSYFTFTVFVCAGVQRKIASSSFIVIWSTLKTWSYALGCKLYRIYKAVF